MNKSKTKVKKHGIIKEKVKGNIHHEKTES